MDSEISAGKLNTLNGSGIKTFGYSKRDSYPKAKEYNTNGPNGPNRKPANKL